VVATFSYFDASFAFTAAVTLYISRALNFSVYPEASIVNIFPFTRHDQSALDMALQLLGHQIAAGNVPAIEFSRLLRLLDNNLQALHATMQTAVNLRGIELNFSTPEISFAAGWTG